jgi:transposase
VTASPLVPPGKWRRGWLVPKQASSGGKPKLLGISKRGDVYLRTLLIHGARAVVKAAANKDDSQSRWVNDLVKRRNHNIAAAVVANKNARVVWALLRKTEQYIGSAQANQDVGYSNMALTNN